MCALHDRRLRKRRGREREERREREKKKERERKKREERKRREERREDMKCQNVVYSHNRAKMRFLL